MSGERDWKPFTGQKIDRLFAWIATEPDGGEGVCGARLSNDGQMMPLIGADRDRVESLRPYAEMTRRVSGYPVRLVEFSTRVDGEELP